MSRRKNSDFSRTRDAVTWYLRHKLLQTLADKVYSQKEIADAMGIPDTRLIYLKQDARGAGWALVDAFARFFRTTPDVLVREALTWWENGGDELSKVELTRIDREKEAAMEQAVAKGKRERRTISSERPSVKLLAATPQKEPSEPPPEKKKRGA